MRISDWSSDVCSSDLILGDVLAGLSQSPKRLPSKYFYDRRGSELFEQIPRQPEYYLTRIELQLLADSAAEISTAVGPPAHVVEYGSGSGRTTRLLLDALDDPVAYPPIGISRRDRKSVGAGNSVEVTVVLACRTLLK